MLAQLFSEHAILLEEVVDGRDLLAMEQAGDGGEEESDGPEARHGSAIV
mgnify:CR=1 FL=1